MKNIMGFSSKVSLSHKKKAIKSLEKLYEENDSFQDCKIDQRTNIYVHNSFQESLGYDKIKKIKTSNTLQTDETPTMEDYLQFLTIYPYYLGKYGFSLKEKQKIFIGPFLLKDKKELRVDTNINPLGMPTFAFQTGEYIRKIPKKQLGGQGEGSGTPNVNTEETVQRNNEEALTEKGPGEGAEVKVEAEAEAQTSEPDTDAGAGAGEGEGEHDLSKQNQSSSLTVDEAISGTAKTQGSVSGKSTSHGSTPLVLQQRQSFQTSHSGMQSNDPLSRGMQSHLRVLKKKINTMESSITNTNSLRDRIHELESILNEINFPNKKKSKELYTIFMLPSYETIKKEKNLDFIKMFIHGGNEVRKYIIQGLFGNEPVFNLLNKHFETAVIKPTPTLKFQYFFGFKKLNKAKKVMKSKEFSVKAEIMSNNNKKKNSAENSNTFILEGGISKSAKRKYINETLKKEASNPYTEEALKNWLKPKYLRDVKHLWKYGRIEKSEHDNLLVDIDKSVNYMISTLKSDLKNHEKKTLQEHVKKKIDNFIALRKTLPSQKDIQVQYNSEKKQQRKKQWNNMIDKPRQIMKRFMSQMKSNKSLKPTESDATAVAAVPPPEQDASSVAETSQTEAPEQDASSVAETPATEPKPPALEVPITVTEPDAVATPAAQATAEAPAVNGGSKRRRKYRIKKKSKNTKKRIRFTLKEKTKKNKYLRILKKRNRKKKQQFTNRAMYKRRSLTRCTRKHI
jgi:hypothetical protein